jgi:cytochrome b561
MNRSSDHFTSGQKTLHWLIALLIVIQVPVGISMVNIMREGAPLTNAFYELHKSFGLTIFALALARVVLRWRHGAPPLVPGIPGWQRIAAYTSHYTLYVLIVLVPIVGWTATSACCPPVNLYWTVPVTLPVSADEATTKTIFRVHYALAFLLTAIVLVHVSAALHHHFVRRDRTLLRMLPGSGSGRERDEVRMPDRA